MASTSKTSQGMSKAASSMQGSSPTSLFLLTEDNILRRGVKQIIESGPFEMLVLLTIASNCVVLALDSQYPEGDQTELSIQLAKTEPYFLGIFTVEASLKIIALGFILHKGSYLRSVWNILDFLVVVTGFVVLLSNMDSLRILTSFRVLRPLKLVYGIPSLQVVLKSVIKAMAPLLQIGLLVLFAIIIFAIIGLEFYNGSFHQTCFSIDEPYVLPDSIPGTDDILLCRPRQPPSPTSSILNISFPKTDSCHPQGTSYFECPPGYVCKRYWAGPNYGLTNFDNIGFAMLTVFQCITMEGWSEIMYMADNVFGSTYNWIYFVPLIILGSFFMLNLVLGVLSGEFAKERERLEKRSEFIKMRQKQQLNNDIDGYLQWIQNAEEMILMEENISAEEKQRIFKARRRAQRLLLKTLGPKENSGETKAVIQDIELATMVEQDETDENKAYRERRFVQQISKRLKVSVCRMVKSQVFFWTVIIVVFLNTVCVSMDYYGQPIWLDRFLYLAEFVFLSIFMTEILIKMFGLGVREYFSSSFNIFDCVVIAGSAFEVVLKHLSSDYEFGLSVLRALRLLRIFKVTKYWSSLRNLVVSLLNSLRSIMSLLLLLFLFLLIFALLGMSFFGGDFNFPEGKPSQHYDNIIKALMTVFQILTGEDWNVLMYDGIRSQRRSPSDSSAMLYSLYFVFLVVLGNYTLLNVFLAIAVDNLTSAHELTAMEEEESMDHDEMRAEKLKRLHFSGGECAGLGEYGAPMLPINLLLYPNVMSEDDSGSSRPYHSKDLFSFDSADVESIESGNESLFSKAMHNREGKPMLPYSSMFVFSPHNSFRRFCHFVVNLRFFDLFIMIVIAASSLALASENPVCEENLRNRFLGYMDHAFTFVFTVEMVLKIVDLGVFLHPESYLRDPWNILDATVVICAIVIFGVTSAVSGTNMDNFKTVKTLRVLRVLRPLKTIKRIPKLKAVFDCVVGSVKNVFNILVVYLLFQFIFAVIAVQLFQGKFYYCTDATKMTREDCRGQFIELNDNLEAVTATREWKVRCFSFDNVVTSLLTLFIVTAGDGWPDILQWSMASTKLNRGPIDDYQPSVAIFYVVFFIVFPFFFVNIFVALIILTFQEQGEADLEDLDLNKNQKNCINFAIMAKPVYHYMPKNHTTIRYRIWQLVTSAAFDYFIMAMIILNTVILMMKRFEHFPNEVSETILRQKAEYERYCSSLMLLNIGFTIVFTLECIMKLMAFGFIHYFGDKGNLFDFITVAGSVVDTILTVIPEMDANLGFLRLFRAARLIKLLRKNQSIRTLLWTFIQSVKALPYVMLLFLMLFFIYSVVAMQLFGNIALDDTTAINRHANFQTFAVAFLLLFRCSTGESWQQVMLACSEGQTCAQGVTSTEPCGSAMAYPFFVSFILLCTFLMLNLFVAVIMDNFDYLTNDSSILGPHHLDEFLQVWSNYDPDATGLLHFSKVLEILRNIEPPLGFGNKCPTRLAYRKLIRMNMPMNEKQEVHFATTLFAVIREALLIKRSFTHEMDTKDSELREVIARLWPFEAKKKLDLLVPPDKELSAPNLTVGKIYAGLLLWDNYRASKGHERSIAAIISADEAVTILTRSPEKKGSNIYSQLNIHALGNQMNRISHWNENPHEKTSPFCISVDPRPNTLISPSRVTYSRDGNSSEYLA